ncbi:MFS transporter [Mumia zhuanghuii]|uniref:MFS transporter n=2 Tax=Mumia TaxID=1546255 RepID=A0ABW1QKJ2_9ACTN|nr:MULTISPECIES: MFS transporter [Mumia]KAA1423689.1 MFS transporter [Mumia zhuanghuii]
MSTEVYTADRVAGIQRRTIGVLASAQVVGGIGAGAALSVGALLVKDVSGSSAVAGLATTMLTLGAALLAVPLAALASARGRRTSLSTGWLIASFGALVVVGGAQLDATWLVLVGLFVVGANSATNFQSRYAATDLAEPMHVGRALSLVVWATTIGSVIGPNLTEAGARTADALDIPDLAGPFVFAAVGFALTATLMAVMLNPDPLRVARMIRPTHDDTSKRSRMRDAWPILRTNAAARTGVVTVAGAHAVMVAVMAMTPVHMEDHGSTLTVIGLTISLHIAGMFALAPVMGILADRWGRGRTITLGQATLLLATLVAGTAGESESRMIVGLVLLGLGWSASIIAGSSLVAQAVGPDSRPAVQGASDLVMNLGGALGGLLAGVIVSVWGFGPLNVVAAFLTIPAIRMVMAGRHRLPH